MTDQEIERYLDRLRALEAQVARLSERQINIERDFAVSGNNVVHLDSRFDKLESKIDWMGKIVGAAILGAIAKFILDGGLSSVSGG